MPPELSPEERDRIRAEEIFREEVRKELEQQRPSKRGRCKIWDFVNTSFGIWLLSSVGLGLLVWSWTLIQEHRHTKKAEQERLTKVNYEIYRDFWTFYGLVEHSWNYEQYIEAHKKTLDRPEYTLSDFKDNTMYQLTWIMGEIPPFSNKERGEKINRIVEALRNDIKLLENRGSFSPAKKKEFDDHIRRILKEDIGQLLYPGQSDAFIFNDYAPAPNVAK